MPSPIDKRLSPSLPRRVLFLNDVSFQYGAGIAQARQVEALLSLGIEVGVLAWAPGNIELEQVATRGIDPDLWLGIRDVDHLEGGKNLPDDAVIAGLVAEVSRFNPEVVLVGNLHAARWPFQLLPALAAIGCRVITFLHDAYLYTGRCAYPGHCTLYLSGCTEACPTADHYPKLAPTRIPAAWRLRREIFGGPHGIDVVANSHWSKRMFLTALPAAHGVETIELGADESIFRPGDKHAARSHLGLPHDKPLVLCAAVNFQEERKGGPHLRAIVEALKSTANFAAFGHNAAEIPGMIGLGYHLRADQLALIYQAADIFLGTATEEAFGQTVMEAQLCGLPTVAFHAGGVVEIVRHNITGLLVRNADSTEAVQSIRTLLETPDRLSDFARQARDHAKARFSLPSHASRWRDYFSGRRVAGLGINPAVIAYPLQESEDLRSLTRHRVSWPHATDWLTKEHETIAARTTTYAGPSHEGEIFKLYEMAFKSGDVILELGAHGGRAAITMLDGARANPSRTLPPLYFCLGATDGDLVSVRTALINEGLGGHAHLLRSTFAEFKHRWDTMVTMVFIDTQRYPLTIASLREISAGLQEGTPVLLSGYLSTTQPADMAVRLAAQEWHDTGGARFMGCFGCSALFVTLKSSP